MKKLLLLLLLPIALQAQNKAVTASRSWIQKEGPAILNTYSQLLALPNHASDLPNIRKNANMIKDLFANRGFAMQLLELDGAPPIVYGERKVPNAQRTLCFYVHYDGQPVDPSTWKNAPFTPVLYDNAMYKGKAHRLSQSRRAHQRRLAHLCAISQ